jgi:hypothetical protein
MIEKFYAAHIKNTLDAAAINVMRPRTARQPTIVSKETDATSHQNQSGTAFGKLADKMTVTKKSSLDSILLQGPLAPSSFRDV